MTATDADIHRVSNTMSIRTAWAIVASRNGLSKKQARRLFPRVLKHAVQQHEVVRQALVAELEQKLDVVTTAGLMVELEVALAMADFDEQAAAVLASALVTDESQGEEPPIKR